MATLDIVQGTRWLYQKQIVCVLHIVDLQQVFGEYEATRQRRLFAVKDLRPLSAPVEEAKDVFLSIPDAAYAKAQDKLAIIQPLIGRIPSAALVAEVAATHGVGCSTLRSWLRAYNRGGSVLALVEKQRSGGAGVSRLAPEVEAVVQEVIKLHYKTGQGKSPVHVYEELTRRFHGSPLPLPALNTLRLRLDQIQPEEVEAARMGARSAKERFAHTRPNTLKAEYPLAVVQLDHALLNIVLVHEDTRQKMSRPWLTLATDVYSRMVVGFYLGFEEPGAGGTGLCLAHAILPKETWLSDNHVEGVWPCWGVMETLHLDNAKEFHGEMLQRGCERYGIKLMYRPPKRPEYGGYVERLIRTLKFHIRRLPGAMVLRPRGRRLVMLQKATFSLPELKRWLATYITNVYHHREHSALGMSPYERYQQGLLGNADRPTRLPDRFLDEKQVCYDFMPLQERTIQRSGVRINRFDYYAEILRPFIGSRDARRFIFKYDPQDLRCIFFLHPTTKIYHRVPLADLKHPRISLWEQREIVRQLLATNPDRKRITQETIFNGLARLADIELAAIRKTGSMTKAARRLLYGRLEASLPPANAPVPDSLSGTLPVAVSPPAAPPPATHVPAPALQLPFFPDVTPFENLDDGTSYS